METWGLPRIRNTRKIKASCPSHCHVLPSHADPTILLTLKHPGTGRGGSNTVFLKVRHLLSAEERKNLLEVPELLGSHPHSSSQTVPSHLLHQV